MKTYTVEIEVLVPYVVHVEVEAASVDDAIDKALKPGTDGTFWTSDTWEQDGWEYHVEDAKDPSASVVGVSSLDPEDMSGPERYDAIVEAAKSLLASVPDSEQAERLRELLP